jgi:site-specific recombinase XerD
LLHRTCRPNAELRSRDYLTDAEVGRLTEVAKGNRYGHRDAMMILIAYRHGLRTSELEFESAVLHVRRAKKGMPSTHPLRGRNCARFAGCNASRNRSHPSSLPASAVPPFTTVGLARMVERAGEAAERGFKAHPHMLRHACGYALANAGHDTRALQAHLGHRNIQHTVRYTEPSPDRFKDFWRK